MRRLVGAWLAAGTLVLAAGGAWAADDGRVALVVGNTDYHNIEPVRTAGVDARALAAALEDLGFDVTVGVDMTDMAMTEALTQLGREAETAEAAVVAFFGRGHQADGGNVLLPIDAAAEPQDGADAAVPLQAAMSAVAEAGRIGVVLVDAARASEKDPAASEGLARPRSVPSGVVVALSAEPGTIVEESYRLHGAFGEALLAHIAAEDAPVADMLLRVRQTVINDTEGAQRPAVFGTVDTMDFSFNPAAAEPEQVADLAEGGPAGTAAQEAAEEEAAGAGAAVAETDMPAVEELAPDAADVETPTLEEMTGEPAPEAAPEPERDAAGPAAGLAAVEEIAPGAADVETPSLDEMTGEAVPEAAPEPDRDAAGPAAGMGADAGMAAGMPPEDEADLSPEPPPAGVGAPGADVADAPEAAPHASAVEELAPVAVPEPERDVAAPQGLDEAEVAAVPEDAAVTPSPTVDPVLSAEERRTVQRSLRRLGLYDARIDAIFGPITRAGVRAFQERIGAEPTGYLSLEQIERLHAMAAEVGG